jgi:hypothetical protein
VPSNVKWATNGVVTWENRLSDISGVARLLGEDSGWMGWCGSEGRIQHQHADAKMQVRGWTNAVYGDPARLWLLFRRTSKKTRYPGGRKCGLPKNAEECAYVCVCGPRGAPREYTVIPDYCTSTRRLRSRMYFPSLYFCDCSYALSCNQTHGGP